MIRKYYATKDNTITNAFNENLQTRATGSNMGSSDILETFSIYNQVSNSSGISSELARILIEFDTDQISSDRTAKLVPSSGSVSWFLKMYNTPHSQTTPTNFSLIVSAVNGAWEEGYGLDMDFYKDETNDSVGSNWVNRSGDNIAEISKFTFSSDTASDYSSGNGDNYVKIYNGNSAFNLYFSASKDDTSGSIGNWSETSINNSGSKNNFASDFFHTVNSLSAFTASLATNIVYVTASTAGTVDAHVNEVGTIAGLTAIVHVSGANATTWSTTGGDYHATPTFTKTFSSGLEDLEIDVSELVEQWIKGVASGGKDNNGFGIKLTDALEQAQRSYYRKKFYGRDSEFFFQKPVLEARWNSARKDDRGYFYASSSLVPPSDNLNTLYLYNRVRGRLRDYPIAPTSASIRVSTHIDTQITSAPVSKLSDTTGIYFANIAVETTASTVRDVWYSGSVGYHTGTISVKTFAASGYNPEDTYVLSMPSLRKEYRKSQTHRLNLYVRQKNWSPNIHTQAVRSSIPSLIMPSASYQLRRSIDDLTIVPYGTASTTMHTQLSYDVSGNYFDLDTTYLEAGYLYDIQYSFYDEENGWEEQPYRFKFRVVD